jgi:hypothetical protein
MIDPLAGRLLACDQAPGEGCSYPGVDAVRERFAGRDPLTQEIRNGATLAG